MPTSRNTPQHTPGPWFAAEPYSTGAIEVRAGQFPEYRGAVALVYEFSAEHKKADARLIAAAPELLEALRGLFEHCAMVHKHWGEGSNAKEAQAAEDFARAAIAKATGHDR